MTVQSGIHRGPWRVLPILGVNVKGTIHDDDEASRHGFRRAIVGGPSVAQAVMPAVRELFGPGWIEGGWLSFKFVGPVYPDERVREVAEPTADPGILDVRVEDEEGRVAGVGQVGMGCEAPWRDADDGQARGADQAFPGLPIGYSFDEVRFSIGEEITLRICDSAGDDTAWYRGESPWGGPVVPPIAAFHPSTRPQRDVGAKQPVHAAGMNAEFHLVTRRPMFRDHAYVLRMKLVDKGVGARTWFWTSHFDITDEEGVHYLSGRQKLKWFLKE